MLSENVIIPIIKTSKNSIFSDYIGDNVGKGYDCLCNLFFDCEETLTAFKFKNVY